jgi:hypothetical protein
MKLDFDDFESWIRDRSLGCMDADEIERLCRGGYDIEAEGPYTFEDQSVQAQWEAWQEAKKGTTALIEAAKALKSARGMVTPITMGWINQGYLDPVAQKAMSAVVEAIDTPS